MLERRTVVVSVIYDAAREYLNSFFTSLGNQTYKNFDILLILDEFEGIEQYIDSFPNLNIRYKAASGSIPSLRKAMIDCAVSAGYEFAIFCDCDDFLSNGRVGGSVELLEHYDICVNDVSLVDENENIICNNYLSKRLKNCHNIVYQDIKAYNFCGLSNTAVRLLSLPELNFNDNLVAVDWYLFSVLLFEGKRAVFSSDFTTFYRQHAENTAGFSSLTPQKLKRAVKVKSIHYNELSKIDKELTEYNTFFNLLVVKIEDHEYFDKYFYKAQSKMPEFPLWWEEAEAFQGEGND